MLGFVGHGGMQRKNRRETCLGNPDGIDLITNYGNIIHGDNQDYLNLLDYIENNDIKFPNLDSLIFSYGNRGFYIDEQQYIATMKFFNSEELT